MTARSIAASIKVYSMKQMYCITRLIRHYRS